MFSDRFMYASFTMYQLNYSIPMFFNDLTDIFIQQIKMPCTLVNPEKHPNTLIGRYRECTVEFYSYDLQKLYQCQYCKENEKNIVGEVYCACYP